MYCLQLRKTTYQFCRRVPIDLRAQFAASTIRHSLQTKDYSEAKRRRNTLLGHYDNEFQRLRLDQRLTPAVASNQFQYEPGGLMSQTDMPIEPVEQQTGCGESISLADLTFFYMAKLKLGGNKKTIGETGVCVT